jgi:hypothetical protein
MNPYEEELPRTRRTRRMIVEYSLHVPVPADQPALPFEPAQPAQGELTIEARFQQFHTANPHVYQALRSLALAEADRGARRISTKLLFEQLRARGCATDTAPSDEYRLNNIYTRCYARLLDREPELTGRIPMRAIKAE